MAAFPSEHAAFPMLEFLAFSRLPAVASHCSLPSGSLPSFSSSLSRRALDHGRARRLVIRLCAFLGGQASFSPRGRLTVPLLVLRVRSWCLRSAP